VSLEEEETETETNRTCLPQSGRHRHRHEHFSFVLCSQTRVLFGGRGARNKNSSGGRFLIILAFGAGNFVYGIRLDLLLIPMVLLRYPRKNIREVVNGTYGSSK
jgi:hypothetical protein